MQCRRSMNVPYGIWLFLTTFQAHCSGFGAQQASTSEPYGKVSQSRSTDGLWLTKGTPKARNSLYTFLRSNNDYNGDYREARLVWKVATGLEESSWHALWREKASALPSRPHSYGQSGEQCTVIPSCFLTAAFEKLHQSRQFSEGNRRSHKHRSTSWQIVAPVLWPSSV